MKSNAIIRIIIFSLAILVLLSIMLGVFTFKSVLTNVKNVFSHVDPVGEEAVLEQMDIEYITPDIRNIEIDWVAGTITIQKDPYATEIVVNEFSSVDSKHRMVLKQSGQTLKIKFSEEDLSLSVFGVDVDCKDLAITVPMNWECNSLEIDAAAAEVMVNDLDIQDFDFDGASGVCRINNCNVKKLDIDTASGDVLFSGTLETLDCDAASADCDIEVFNVPRSIKMDGMSGDLELILPPDAGFICDLDTMSGSFNSDFTFQTHDGTYVCGDGKCKINVNGMSGAVSILKGIK